MKYSLSLIIYTFVITALYDVILRKMSENYDELPEIIQYDFIRMLRPYFRKHTLLGAALIAGVTGAVAQQIIFTITSGRNPRKLLFITFLVSAALGPIMQETKLFPHLDQYYYKPLGPFRSAYHDGISGLIVQLTILLS